MLCRMHKGKPQIELHVSVISVLYTVNHYMTTFLETTPMYRKCNGLPARDDTILIINLTLSECRVCDHGQNCPSSVWIRRAMRRPTYFQFRETFNKSWWLDTQTSNNSAFYCHRLSRLLCQSVENKTRHVTHVKLIEHTPTHQLANWGKYIHCSLASIENIAKSVVLS